MICLLLAIVILLLIVVFSVSSKTGKIVNEIQDFSEDISQIKDLFVNFRGYYITNIEATKLKKTDETSKSEKCRELKERQLKNFLNYNGQSQDQAE